MVHTINQVLNTKANKVALNKLVDETRAFLIDPDKEGWYAKRGKKPVQETLNQFALVDMVAPMTESDDFSFLKYKVRRNTTIASITATSGEIPATSMGQLLKMEGSTIKITLSYTYNEEIQIRMIELSQSQHIPKEFLKLLFGSVNDLQIKSIKTANVLTCQMLYQGRVVFVDPRTNMAVEIEQPDIVPKLFPEANTGQRSWDQYATANGIQDLINLNTNYYQENGCYPEYNVMSRATLNHLLRQEETARFAASMGLISDSPVPGLATRMSRKVLNEMIKDHVTELVPIKEWDARYSIETEPGKSVDAPYIPDGRVTLVRENMMERAFAPTIEGTRVNNGRPKKGIHLVAAEEVSKSPVEERSYGVSRFVPYVIDGRQLSGQRVVEEAA